MYFKITYNQNGKDFDCLVKADSQNRYWTTIYINPKNPKYDCFLRRELASPLLYRYAKEIDEKQFNSALEQLFLTCQQNEHYESAATTTN